MISRSYDVAPLLAADLAGSRVDPNEAQKALAYLRSKRDGKQFFEYLRAINKDGRAVIRSGQTLGYYRDLLAACERHLRPLQNDPQVMLDTLAWAIRLLRYYRAVPDAAELMQLGQAPAPQAEAVPQKPAAPTLPAVGEVVTWKVIAVDESLVILEVPGLADDKAIGALKAEMISDGRTARYRVGNTARVEVQGIRQTKSGRTIVDLKSAQKMKP